MASLPEVTQEITVSVAGYVGGLQLAIDAAEKFKTANIGVIASVLEVNAVLGKEAASAAEAAAANTAAAGSSGDAARAAAEQAASTDAAAGAARDLAASDVALAAANDLVAGSYADLGRTASYLNDTYGLIVTAAETVMASSSRLESLNRSMADSFDLIRSSASAAYLDAARLASMNESVTAQFAAWERLEAEMAADAAGLQDRLTAARLAGMDASLALAQADAALAAVERGQVAPAFEEAASAATRATYAWGLTGNAIHWIISGTTELLAVLVPATVAAASWAFVWVQGATNVYQHLSALFTATEALGQQAGQTYGEMLGLKGVFQQMQNAANPQVYQALGAALNLVKENTSNLASVGYRMGQIFDTFLGKLVYEFSAAGGAGKTLDSVLSGMIPDLTGIGQVFGNLGHLIASFASQMPGLAEALLQALAGLLDLAKGISDFAQHVSVGSVSVITLIMALEETNRWGGALIGLFGKMGMASSELATGIFNPVRAMGVLSNIVLALPMGLASLTTAIGSTITRFAAVNGAIGNAGLAMMNFGEESRAALGAIGPLQGALIALAAAGLGFLIYKIATFKTAAQELGVSLQDTVQKASNFSILSTVGANLDILQQHMAQATATMHEYARATADGTTVMGSMSRFASAQGSALQQQAVAYQNAAANMRAYSASQVQQVGDAANTVAGAQKIAQWYGISVPAAMALARSAGVNLSNAITTQSGAWNALGEKVRDAYSGYKAMGQSAGMVGSDMLALAIQTGLAGTKMSQLNQAWDSFMQNVTGGTGGISSLEESIQNIGHVVTDTANHLANATGGMTISTKQFADAMTSYTGKGAEAWSNFNQIVGSTMPQLADWFRTAASEGALGADGSDRMTKAILDMTSTMVPFAARSKTAQAELVAFAQQAGLNIRTFPELETAIRNSGASAKNLAAQVSDATVKMGDMATIAQNLGDVMNSDFTTAISNAALKASGFDTATSQLTTDLKQYAANSPQVEAAVKRVTQDFNNAQAMAGRLTAQAHSAQGAIDAMHGKTIDITTYFRTVGSGGSPQYAGGGPKPHAAAGAAYLGAGDTLVGEHGPEIMHVPAGASATPNWATEPILRGGGGGSQAPVVHVHLHGDLADDAIWDRMQVRTFEYNTNNQGRRSGTWAP